jgi:hypothetical protein
MINQRWRSVKIKRNFYQKALTALTLLSVLITIAGISWISDGGYAQSSQDLENNMINAKGGSNTNLQIGIGLTSIQSEGTAEVCDDVPKENSILNSADSNTTNSEGVSNDIHTNLQVGVGDLCEKSSNNKNVVVATDGGIIQFSGNLDEPDDD